MLEPYNSISSTLGNPLGTTGLDYSGAYGSYLSPMGGMPGMLGMNGIGNMGMLGMYNPTFMQQMMDAQNNIERKQIYHSSDMHEAMLNAEVASKSAHERANFQKIISDGDIQHEIRLLQDTVVSGDSIAIKTQYNKLKALVCSKFAKDFIINNNGDVGAQADKYINEMYSKITQKQSNGLPADLTHDIKRYGESAFMNGFNSTFLGNKGHNEMYTEELLADIHGTRINDKGSKERAKQWGKYAAKGAEGAGALVGGFFGGIGLLGLTKFLPFVKFDFFKYAKNAGRFGALALLAGDILWQMSRSNS